MLAPRTSRLSDAFAPEPPFPIGSLAPLACNIRAIEAGADFARAFKPFVAIVGPSGWGKTHLLDSTALAIALYQGHSVRVFDARAWALYAALTGAATLAHALLVIFFSSLTSLDGGVVGTLSGVPLQVVLSSLVGFLLWPLLLKLDPGQERPKAGVLL